MPKGIYVRSEEFKEKCRNRMLGMKFSEETKKKMKEGKPNTGLRLDLILNEVYKLGQTDYHNNIIEKIEGMKLEIPEYRNKRGHHTNSAHMKIRHNKALQMVLSLLQDTNPKEL